MSEPTRVTNSGQPPMDGEHLGVPNVEKREDGQHVDHWILSDAERAKGFVRPVRRTYVHTVCGVATSMPQKIAETYAANPRFYGSTFCCGCGGYFPVGATGDFVWDGTSEKVGI